MKISSIDKKSLEKNVTRNKNLNFRSMQTNVPQINEYSSNNKTINQPRLTRNIIKYNYSSNSIFNSNNQKSYTNSLHNDFKKILKNSSYIIPLIKKKSNTPGETNNLPNISLIKNNKNSNKCSFKFQNLNDSLISVLENVNIGTCPSNKKIFLKKISPKVTRKKRDELFKVHLCKNNINNDEDKLIIENINNNSNDDKYPTITNTKSKYGGIINPYKFNHNVFFGKSFLDINSWNNNLLKSILPENIDDLPSVIEKSKKINKSESTTKKCIKMENISQYNGSFFNSKISKFFSSFSSKNNLIKENSKINYDTNNSIIESRKNIGRNINNDISIRNISQRNIKQGNSYPVKILNYKKIDKGSINTRSFKKLNRNIPNNVYLYSLYSKKIYN